jgi:hypothetical protein
MKRFNQKAVSARAGWSRTLLAACAAMLMAGAGVSQAQTNTASRKASLSDYKVVYERNIFNPKRYARATGERPREASRSARVETLALVGIMAYEKGTFAFFDGSSSGFKTALKLGEKVAGLELAGIEANSVTLKSGTNVLALDVGSQLRRADGEEWSVSGKAEFADSRTSSNVPPNPAPATTTTQDQSQPSFGEFPQPPEGVFSVGQPMAPPEMNGQSGPSGEAAPAAAPAAPADNSANQAAPASGGSEDDVLRRLMQRREQELNR